MIRAELFGLPLHIGRGRSTAAAFVAGLVNCCHVCGRVGQLRLLENRPKSVEFSTRKKQKAHTLFGMWVFSQKCVGFSTEYLENSTFLRGARKERRRSPQRTAAEPAKNGGGLREKTKRFAYTMRLNGLTSLTASARVIASPVSSSMRS